jgi:hypothetical protein
VLAGAAPGTPPDAISGGFLYVRYSGASKAVVKEVLRIMEEQRVTDQEALQLMLTGHLRVRVMPIFPQFCRGWC